MALYYFVVLFSLLVIIGIRQELSSYANKAAVQFALMFLLFAIPNIFFMSWENSRITLDDRPSDQIYASVHRLIPGTVDSESQLMGLDSNGNLKLTELQQGPGIFGTLVREPVALFRAAVRDDYNFYFRGVQRLVPVWLIPLIGLGLFKLAWTRREGLKYGYFALVMAPLVILPVTGLTRASPCPTWALSCSGWRGAGSIWRTGARTRSRRSPAGKRSPTRVEARIKVVLAALVLVPLAALSIWNIAHVSYPVEYPPGGRVAEGERR